MHLMTWQTTEWLDSKQIKDHYGINKQKLYRLLKEKKICSKTLVTSGASRGKRLWHQGSIREYMDSLGDGVHTQGDPDYRYNHADRFGFPRFVIQGNPQFFEISLN